MKIALLTPTFSSFSGIDRVVDEQARQLIEKGDSVDIFCFDSDMRPSSQAALHVLGMPRKLFWQRVYRLLLPLDFIKNRRIVEGLAGFDLAYSHQYPMNWLACLAKKRFGLKYIYYDYGIAPPAAFEGPLERLYISLFTRLSNMTAGKADGAVSISKYLQEELRKQTGLVSEVAYPKINTQRFHPGLDGSAVRQKYNLEGRQVALYVGRISPHKGIHLLIEAFNRVRSKHPEARLLIVGKHTFDAYSRRLAAMGGQGVIFTGYVPDEDIPAYYAACDVYATATMWEGFDLPLAEAGACGKPALAFRLGPHPEIVEDGRTGVLVDPFDVNSFAEALHTLMDDRELNRRMGATAARLVAERFA